MGQHPPRNLSALGDFEFERRPPLSRRREMARPRLELLARHAALLFIARVTKDLFAHRFHRFTRIRKRRTHSQNLLNLRSLWRTLYEENRHSFWSRAQFSAGVCRAGESENRRQRNFQLRRLAGVL